MNNAHPARHRYPNPARTGTILEPCESRVLLSTGLDPSFGSGGALVVPLPGDNYIYAAAQLPDGRVLLAGRSEVDGDSDILVLLRLADGSPDPAFGTGGAVVLDLGSPADAAYALAVQPDGRIVLAGQTVRPGSFYDWAVLRLNPNGTLDSSFGTGGHVFLDIAGSFDQATAVSLSGTSIVVAGHTQVWGDSQPALARLDAAGQLDGSFGVAGVGVLAMPGYSVTVSALAPLPDGRAVLGATAMNQSTWDNDFAILRVAADGALDPTFGTAGVAVVDLGSDDFLRSVVVGAASAVFAAGGSAGDFAVLKLDATGQPAGDFGIAGKVLLDVAGDYDVATALGVTADGGLLVVGRAVVGDQADWAVALLSATGVPNSSFGTGGALTIDLGQAEESALACVVSGATAIVAGFTLGAEADPAAVRLVLEEPTPPQPPADPPPTIVLHGPATGVRGQPRHLQATFSGNVTSVAWSFGDGQSAVLQSPAADVWHAFKGAGTYVVTASVQDAAGQTATASLTIAIAAWMLEQDAAGRTNLLVGGTEANDIIVFRAAQGRQQRGICLSLNGAVAGPFNITGRVIAWGQVGDDLIVLANSANVAAEFYGGDGNDLLKGGRKSDTLVGGTGQDWLLAGPSRGDVLDSPPARFARHWRAWRPWLGD